MQANGERLLRRGLLGAQFDGAAKGFIEACGVIVVAGKKQDGAVAGVGGRGAFGEINFDVLVSAGAREIEDEMGGLAGIGNAAKLN